MRVFALAYKKATTTTSAAVAFKTPNTHAHTHTHRGIHIHIYSTVVKRVQVGKNKTFSQLIALNLKCCKINSRVMPNTQAQSFMQTETANAERKREQESERRRGKETERSHAHWQSRRRAMAQLNCCSSEQANAQLESRARVGAREAERKRGTERTAHGYERACGHAQWTWSCSRTCSWTGAARKCGVDER